MGTRKVFKVQDVLSMQDEGDPTVVPANRELRYYNSKIHQDLAAVSGASTQQLADICKLLTTPSQVQDPIKPYNLSGNAFSAKRIIKVIVLLDDNQEKMNVDEAMRAIVPFFQIGRSPTENLIEMYLSLLATMVDPQDFRGELAKDDIELKVEYRTEAEMADMARHLGFYDIYKRIGEESENGILGVAFGAMIFRLLYKKLNKNNYDNWIRRRIAAIRVFAHVVDFSATFKALVPLGEDLEEFTNFISTTPAVTILYNTLRAFPQTKTGHQKIMVEIFDEMGNTHVTWLITLLEELVLTRPMALRLAVFRPYVSKLMRVFQLIHERGLESIKYSAFIDRTQVLQKRLMRNDLMPVWICACLLAGDRTSSMVNFLLGSDANASREGKMLYRAVVNMGNLISGEEALHMEAFYGASAFDIYNTISKTVTKANAGITAAIAEQRNLTESLAVDRLREYHEFEKGTTKK